ncbi:MAG: hypothetical protein ABSF22_12170 [Bryobacteraceae bacterium]|jgi:hypothetical protein
MAKKPAAPPETPKTEAAAPVEKVLTKSKKIPKLAKKDKHRLPRKEKKANKKAALKAS